MWGQNGFFRPRALNYQTNPFSYGSPVEDLLILYILMALGEQRTIGPPGWKPLNGIHVKV